MDSGLSSPDDIDFDDTDSVLNSTTLSSKSALGSRRSLPFYEFQRGYLSSPSREASCSTEDISYRGDSPSLLGASPRGRLRTFNSVQDLSPMKRLGYSSSMHDISPSRHVVSSRDVSCSTEDLSPIKPNVSDLEKTPVDRTQSMLELPQSVSISSAVSTSTEVGLPRTQSMILSPETNIDDVEDVFGDEEYFVAAEENSKKAADLLTEKRSELKALIDKYREAEIVRVQAEKENLSRAEQNEKSFKEQQTKLETLQNEQRKQLEAAKQQLDDFVLNLNKEKFLRRQKVEKEIDILMELKRKRVQATEGVEVEVRKHRFKLKAKIEDYWKRMDLYDNLLIELELERLKTEYAVRAKASERLKELDSEPSENLEVLRERKKLLEDLLDRRKDAVLEARTACQDARREQDASKVQFETRIKEAEDFVGEVRSQAKSIANNHQKEMEKLNEELKAEEEKFRHYTISNTIESPTSEGLPDRGETNTVTCSIQEIRQRDRISALCRKKLELDKNFNGRMKKYDGMVSDAERSLTELQEASQLELEKHTCDLSEKEELLAKLESQFEQEKTDLSRCKVELRAHERPRSYISDHPAEVEEDMQALEIQREQLVQSKKKVKEHLESALRKEFEYFTLIENGRRKSAPSLDGSYTETPGGVGEALSLIFHSGDTAVHINSIVKKHAIFEEQRRNLSDIKKQLRDLKKKQLSVHHELSTNFLSQKVVLEELRSKEREEIHGNIQMLVDAEGNVSTPEHVSKMYKAEANKILSFQQILEDLEQSLHKKMEESSSIEQQLLDIQDRINKHNAQYSDTSDLSNQFSFSLEDELGALEHQKDECENLITDLRKKLDVERKEYLEVLRSKDEYEVIGQEYREARHSYFKVEGNQAAAEILQEVFWASNALDAQRNPAMAKRLKTAGWKVVGREKDVTLFRKTGLKPGCVCVIGHGVVKASPKVVWDAVRNPLSRLIYDNMVKKISIVEHVSDSMKVVYFHHEARVCLLKQSRDFCCVQVERHESNDKYVSAFKSVEHPDCPSYQKIIRGKTYPSGWVVEPYYEEGREWTSLWYLVKVDIGEKISSYFINSLAKKLPLSLHYLRNYLVLS